MLGPHGLQLTVQNSLRYRASSCRHQIKLFQMLASATQLAVYCTSEICCGTEVSLGRHQIVAGHNATNEVMLISCHARQSDIASGTGVRTIQPQRDVGQGGPLILVDGASITDADRVVHHRFLMAFWHIHVCEGVDCHPSLALRHHHEAAPFRVKGFHGANHAIHEVVLLVDVSGQNNAEAHIDRHFRRHQRTVCPERGHLRVIVLVIPEISGECAKKSFVAVVEQDVHGQNVDDGGTLAGARDERRLAVCFLDDVVNVKVRGLVVARPSFVLVA